MRVEQYFKNFERLLKAYDHSMPLHRFLPAYFRRNRNMGSKDRKMSASYMYTYFRLGLAMANESKLDRLCVADFLCNKLPTDLLNYYYPAWSVKIGLSVEEKIDFVQTNFPDFALRDIFPSHEKLSMGIDFNQLAKSMFVQPDVFIRVFKGYEQKIKESLQEHDVFYTDCGEQCLAVPAGSKLDLIFDNEPYFEVQDWASQQTGNYFQPQPNELWWDCCAGAGGKSLLLHSIEPSVKLTVSDIRLEILENLRMRFTKSKIKDFSCRLLDASKPLKKGMDMQDGIILDAPCTGSGTWGRTPEYLSKSHRLNIEGYQYTQQRLIENASLYLKQGKPLIYITCSIYEAENEQNVAFAQTLGLRLESQKLIQGFDKKADSMFVARLIKE